MVRESFDIHFIIEKFPAILSALPVTLEITAVTLVLGWLLGLLVAWGKVSGSGWLKKFLGILTDIIRGIPTVVLLYIVYFGLPKLINVSNWSKISFVVLALMIELGTTSSEMFRSAYNSIQKGQLEAAHALGYTEIQKFFHIIFLHTRTAFIFSAEQIKPIAAVAESNFHIVAAALFCAGKSECLQGLQ